MIEEAEKRGDIIPGTFALLVYNISLPFISIYLLRQDNFGGANLWKHRFVDKYLTTDYEIIIITPIYLIFL